MLRTNDEYSKAVEASLKALSRAHTVRVEKVGLERTYLVDEQKEQTRIVFGEYGDPNRFHDKSVVVVAWGRRPLPYAKLPSSKVTYFDLRFETHSRVLGTIASELKGYLEAQGWRFREFDPIPARVKRGSKTGSLPRRLVGAARRELSIGS
jgi:hypothetical protein